MKHFCSSWWRMSTDQRKSAITRKVKGRNRGNKAGKKSWCEGKSLCLLELEMRKGEEGRNEQGGGTNQNMSEAKVKVHQPGARQSGRNHTNEREKVREWMGGGLPSDPGYSSGCDL